MIGSKIEAVVKEPNENGDVKGHRLKVIAWQPFPDYEGKMEIEEELPFK